MEGPKIVENIFFTVTCVSVFTCIIRSDYNFAMGLLCYYMIKNASDKIGKIAGTVSQLSLAKWHTLIYPVFNTYFLVDSPQCDDHRYGCPLDRRHEISLGRKTH